ncbi:MAG: ROK family protein [Candidatus Anstonellaceae archaeon]
MQKILGIDIGASKIEWTTEEYLKKPNLKTKILFIDKEISKKALLKIIKKIINLYPEYKKIGISIAGLVKKEKIDMPNLKKIKNFYPKIGKKGIEIRIENDAKCAAISQIYKNLRKKKKKIKNFIVICAGSGIGSGIVIDNKLYRGQNNLAGEIGHQIMNKKEFEELAAGFNIKKDFSKKYKKMAYYFGIGLTNLANLLDVDIIYIGGSLGKEYLKNKKSKKVILEILKRYCINKKIKIRLCDYKNPSLAGAILLFENLNI